MAPPTKGQRSKKPRIEGIPECMIVDEIPTDLWHWWRNMGDYEQRRVKEHLGHLVHLMEINPRRDVIEALIHFWDPKNNVFRFSDFEMTPTLEEIAAFMGKGSSIRGADLRNKRPIVPKVVDGNKFLDLLKINQLEKESLKNGWISLSFLYERYGKKDGFDKYQTQLSNQGGVEAWKVNGRFAFMVAFLGLIVFPERDKHIDIRLAGVVKALITMKNPTIVPMILADIFRALTKCKKGATYFEGCNILLQMWFLEHFYHHNRAPRFASDWSNYVSTHQDRATKVDFPEGILACEEKLSMLTSDEIVWNYYWFPEKDVICMSSGISFLVLIGFRGVQPYAPLRVMRQLARIQEIPPNEDMSRFMFDIPLISSFDSGEILEIWFGSIISEHNDMVIEQDKGEVVPAYKSWFHNPSTFSETVEGFSRKRKDQHTIRQLRRELEQSKATIEQQQVQVQAGRNHQLRLQDVEDELKQAGEKIVQLEDELNERIHLTRQLRREQNVEIFHLKRDLVAFENVMHHQKEEFEQQKEQFEKERFVWAHSKQQFQAQLEDQRKQINLCAGMEEEMRQMIIERATLRNRLEILEEREGILENNLSNHQTWLKICHENMGQARRQVHQMAEQVFYIIKDHRRWDDIKVAEQARSLVPHLPQVLVSLYKTLGGRQKPQEDPEE